MANRTCSVDGCEKPVATRGWCGMHYWRWKTYGDLFYKAPRGGLCSIEGCEKRVLARGWCDKHYRRWQHNGDPLVVQHVDVYAPDAQCLVDGCQERPDSLGYCTSHYGRFVRHGDATRIMQASPYAPDAKCEVEGCDRPPRARGYCLRHRSNLRNYGNPVPRKERPLEERLREIGWTVTGSGCWEWDGKRNDHGYGIFNAKFHGYENDRAHRAMFECFVRKLAPGEIVRHKCDNPPCVNPDHLLPGTMADNTRDMMERGRHYTFGRTRCANGHDLTAPGATRTVRRKGRKTETICVACNKDRQQRYYARKAATKASS